MFLLKLGNMVGNTVQRANGWEKDPFGSWIHSVSSRLDWTIWSPLGYLSAKVCVFSKYNPSAEDIFGNFENQIRKTHKLL